MSDGNPGFKYYPVPRESLHLLKDYDAGIQAYQTKRQEVIVEYQQRLLELAQENNENLERLWGRLSASVGLDPAMTWKNPAYQIETRYTDSGFGAITFVPQEADLNQLLGRDGSEAVEQTVPKDATIN